MTERQPPFPAPLGMTWDADKKRFFKAVPGTAVAAVANAATPAKQQRLRQRQARDRQLLHGRNVSDDEAAAVAGLCLNSNPPSPLPASRRMLRTGFRHALQSSIPRLSTANSSQHSLAQRHLADLRHVRTAYVGCDPDGFQFCNHQVGVRSLQSNDQLGALIFFMTWNKQVTMIDTSSLWPNGNSSVQLHSALTPWTASRRSFQTSPSPSSDQEMRFACSIYEANPDTPDCFAMDKTCFAYFSMRKRLHVQHLDITATGEKLGRTISHVPQRNFTFTIDDKWLEDGIITVSIRALATSGHAITCIGHGREVCIVHSWPTPSSSDGRKAHGLAQYKLKSDVLSHDFSPDGRRLLVGCRNGRIMCLDTTNLHVAEVFPFAFDRGMKKLDKSDTLPYKLDGAVTNLRFTSASTLLAVSSHGEVVLLSLSQPDKPLINFLGHVNAWTLNTPLAVDFGCRVFALAGQDRKVRIWSMDDPLPLRTSPHSSSIPLNVQEHSAHGLRLSDASFVGDLTGLTFCSRHDLARLEANQNVAFLAHGLPALAVSCGRKSIAFFE